jgi:hypothetical protein
MCIRNLVLIGWMVIKKIEDRSNRHKNKTAPTEEWDHDGVSPTTSKMAVHGGVQQILTEGAPGGFRQERQS